MFLSKAIRGWHPYQSCHEKRHLNVCRWVGFLARHFTRGNFTLFEIPNKSFVLYAFISKNRHEQDLKETFLFCIFFPSCFAILLTCLCFQYSIFLDCTILRKCLHTTLSVAGKKQRYTHQRCT